MKPEKLALAEAILKDTPEFRINQVTYEIRYGNIELKSTDTSNSIGTGILKYFMSFTTYATVEDGEPILVIC